MNKELKQTFKFVFFIATPLCLINSLIFSFNSTNFLSEWFFRFLYNYIITFPQAVLYVSIVKKIDKNRS